MSTAMSDGRSVTRVLLPPAAALLLALVACDGQGERAESTSPPTAEQGRGELSPVVAARLDSGNAAYRQGDYERALDHYRRAAGYQEESPAPWFGIFMVHRARGDSAAADTALAQVRELSPEASLVHPEPGDTSAARDTAGG